MSVKNLTLINFDEEVSVAGKTVLVDFWAGWCGPCRMLAPVVEEVASQRPDISVCKVDIDDQSELAARFDVMSIPTLLVFKNGKLVNRTTGAVPKSRILAMLA